MTERWIRNVNPHHRPRVDVMEELLACIKGQYDGLLECPTSPPSSPLGDDIPALSIPLTSLVDWDTISPGLDPMRGGGITSKDSAGFRRGMRKRLQVQAFYYLLETILQARNDDESTRHNSLSSKGLTIVDAGCGAGNLAISLAGLLLLSNLNVERDGHILAVDINEVALDLLSQRAATSLDLNILHTLCADLSDYERIISHIPIDNDIIVMSLHACGAATDYAMELAYRCKAPFIVCPCCTAKSLTRRKVDKPLSSPAQRSSATVDMVYPRSVWLHDILSSMRQGKKGSGDFKQGEDKGAECEENDSKFYSLLAKAADLGLDPRATSQQRAHQRRAKQIVELDRVMHAVEQHGYVVRLVRIPDDCPWGYGKGEVIVGTPQGSAAAASILQLLDLKPMVDRLKTINQFPDPS